MATAEQLKALLKSHFSGEKERFYTISLQLAAHESRQGHASLANELRSIIDDGKKKNSSKIIPFPNELQGLVLTEDAEVSKSSLIIPQSLQKRIDRIIHEYRQKGKLKSHGLNHRRKILLTGPPGTGKTMTAKVLSRELGIKLNTIQVDRLVTKFMGETSAKLRQIFEMISQSHGIYLFDEFDAIGAERTMDNDVGEMRRVLNAFLQFIEQDHSDSLIIAATNNPRLLDHALFRRFEDVLTYQLPSAEERQLLIKNIMGSFLQKNMVWNKVLKQSKNLCHAEIDHACKDAIKSLILSGKTKGNAALLIRVLSERQNTYRENPLP
ncbi:MAG: ATPase [Desulfobacterales bacterium RIFOXYA12_FULL_46_15]|nr:MAG: ATPase [Desulfobacterales bacterium RIFOXYA12_FULL_46_15]